MGIQKVQEGQGALGIIDSLSAGFAKINGMLWVLLFPLAMGFFLWRGPVLSAAPAFNSVLDWYMRLVPPDALGSSVDQINQIRDGLQSLFGEFNLLSFLTLGVGLAGRGAIPVPSLPTTDQWIELPAIIQPIRAVGLMVLIEVAGLFLGACYLGLIAQRVRGEATSVAHLAHRVWGYWWSLLGFLLAVIGAVIVICVPISILLGLALVLAPAAADAMLVIVALGWQIVAIWLVMFMFFVVDAAVVAQLGPLRAMRSSIQVVRQNLWSAFRFILLYLLITYGMLALWGQLGDNPLSVVVTIVGNAYIASGLLAGSMVYYRSRSQAIESAGTRL
jgi:hypothetical protein